MKAKVKKFFNRPIILALLFNLGVFGALMLIACPKFSTDIDILMQSILYGIGDVGSDMHMIYINILPGELLTELFVLAPNVAWYAVLQFVLVFVGLFSMTYAVLRRPGNLVKRLIVLFFLCFAGYECYITLSYIKTTVVLCAAAFCILACAMMDERLVKKSVNKAGEESGEISEEKPEEEELVGKPEEKPDGDPEEKPDEDPEKKSDEKEAEKLEKIKKNLMYVWCAALLWLSSLLSFRIFLIAAVLCVGGILIAYLGKKMIKIRAFGIVAIAVAVVLVAGSQGFDHYKYASDEVYATERENAQAVEKLYVFGTPDYSDELEEITGLDKEEYSALADGRFVSYDENVTDYFQIVAGIGRTINGQNILKFFRTVPIRMFQYAIFFCCVILVALAYLSNRKNKRILILPVALWLASYLIFFFGNAWSGTTVHLVVLLPVCALTMMQYEELSNKCIRGLAAFTCIFALIMYSSFHSRLVTSVDTNLIEEDYMGRYKVEKTYVTDVVSYLEQFSIFQVYPQGLFDKDNVTIANGIYRNVRGYEDHFFVTDDMMDRYVSFYYEKHTSDILIGQDVQEEQSLGDD